MKKELIVMLTLVLFFAAGIVSVRAESTKVIKTTETTITQDNYADSDLNSGITSSGAAINPDNNIYPGGRSRNGITPNPVDNAAEIIAANAVKVRRLDDANALPADSKIYFRGEVVNVDRDANQIVVRDNSGATGFYVVNDRSSLNSLQQGDQVEIFR